MLLPGFFPFSFVRCVTIVHAPCRTCSTQWAFCGRKYFWHWVVKPQFISNRLPVTDAGSFFCLTPPLQGPSLPLADYATPFS